MTKQKNRAGSSNKDMPLVFVNGKPVDYISVSDRGLNYGHGLFESMRIAKGEAPLWSWHQRRLCADAVTLGIKIDEQRLTAYLQQALAAVPDDGVLKLTVTAGKGSAGYRDTKPEANYCFQFRALPTGRTPLILQPCTYRLPHNPVLGGIKHLNRLDQVLAAGELSASGDKLLLDGLLLDVDGTVVEALSNNLFCLLDGQWLTPDVSLCGVKGVMREYLRTEVFPALGMTVLETRFGLDELARAEAVFVCNSVRGIEPVAEILACGKWEDSAVVTLIRAQLAAQVACFTG